MIIECYNYDDLTHTTLVRQKAYKDDRSESFCSANKTFCDHVLPNAFNLHRNFVAQELFDNSW